MCTLALRATLSTAVMAGCAVAPHTAPHTAPRTAPRAATGGVTAPGALADPQAPRWRERAPEVYRVRVETTQGAFVVEGRRTWAPRGADRFYQLARAGFFDDSRFFRVRSGFVVQFGIAGNPAVATAWRAAALLDDSVRQHNTRGTVSYAMTGPDTRTTQLFINLADNTRLDAQGFAPLGVVVEGMDVVERLYAGYGEASGGGMRGGQQDSLFAGGNAYLDRAYPRLDRLLRVRVEAGR